jgi:hypothetical protein
MRSSLRLLPIYTILGMLLVGCGPALGQSASPSFPERIKEVARELHNQPGLNDLSEQERIDRLEFVVGNTLFVLLHELGHVHFSEMRLPVLGREENEADTFATITLLKIGTNFSQRVLGTASQGWFLSDRRNEQTKAKPHYGVHDVSLQRAYQIVCLMVGSDPAKFKKLADDAKMPEPRRQSCKQDYAKASRSWDMVLAPYRRRPDQPKTKIDIGYGDAKGDFEEFARTFRAIRILERVAEGSASTYVWSAPFTLEMRSCDGPNAGWDDETRTVKICYQLAFDFAQLYLAYVQAALPQATVKKRRRT